MISFYLKHRLVEVHVTVNSRLIREITTDPWWTSYDILHLPCDDKIKGVAMGVGRPSHMLLKTEGFQEIHKFYCISVGRDIHVDIKVPKNE